MTDRRAAGGAGVRVQGPHLVGAVADGQVEGFGGGRAAAALPAELHRLHILVQHQQRRLVHIEERALQRVQVPVVRLQQDRLLCNEIDPHFRFNC